MGAAAYNSWLDGEYEDYHADLADADAAAYDREMDRRIDEARER